MMKYSIDVANLNETIELGKKLGLALRGGEVLELIGDIGAGKTSLTKGIAKGLAISEEVQSPTFTISRNYDGRDGLILAHYDFYRLNDAGIMEMELSESINEPHTITVVEWSGVINSVLPSDVLRVSIFVQPDDSRRIVFESGGVLSDRLIKEIQK